MLWEPMAYEIYSTYAIRFDSTYQCFMHLKSG